MTHKQIENFIMISKCRSLSEAADKLFISQQALGISMSKLEEELNTKLIQRSHSGVSLTSDGELFLKDAREFDEMVVKWRNYSSDSRNVVRGEVHIASSEQTGFAIVNAVSSLKKEYPGISVIHHDVCSPDVPDFLFQRRASIGICTYSPQYPKGALEKFAEKNDLHMEELCKAQLYLYVNSHSSLAGLSEITLKECGGLTFVSKSEEAAFCTSNVPEYFHDHGGVFSSIMSVLQMISKNENCATILPSIVMNEYAPLFNGRITTIPLKGEDTCHPIFLICPEQPRRTTAERLMTERLYQEYSTKNSKIFA